MAIKVVRKPETLFRERCGRCGCEFTYELSDLRGYYGGIAGSQDWIKCPGCGQSVHHKRQTYGGSW